MKFNASEGNIENYVYKNIMEKEQSNALFLLNKSWVDEIKNKYPKNNVKEIADGIVYFRMTKNINSKNVKINVAQINRSVNPNIDISPKLASSKLHSRKKINMIASGAKIAVNGTYFKQDTGTPLGTLVIDNKIITGPIYERVVFGIADNGFRVSRAAFDGYVKSGNNVIKINNINQPRMMYTEVLMYTPTWGERAPLAKSGSLYVAVSSDVIISVTDTPVVIPKDGYVISSDAKLLSGLKKGEKITAEYKLSPDWNDVNHIISGGPYLLKDGEIFIDVSSQKLNGITGRNPRTAIGYTKDNVMIIVTVDGRKENVSGVTLKELADILKDLGCYEAINLDGGSSTVMYVDGTVISGSNIMSASISNALTVSIKG